MKKLKILCVNIIGNKMILSLCSISSKYKWDFFELISPNKPVIGKEDYENLSCFFNIVMSFNKDQSTSPIIKNIQSIKRITTRKRKHDSEDDLDLQEFDSFVTDETDVTYQEIRNYEHRYAQMNANQKHVFDKISESINSKESNSHFFLQGPAGTGKTFVFNTLCNYYRGQGKIVLCVASSGIAALLSDGRTSHSRFAIPLKINNLSSCHIKKDSMVAELIKKTTLIIWDEVPMQHRHCFEAVDRTFRNLCGGEHEDKLFGGVPVVLGGDFEQIPPVVTLGGKMSNPNYNNSDQPLVTENPLPAAAAGKNNKKNNKPGNNSNLNNANHQTRDSGSIVDHVNKNLARSQKIVFGRKYAPQQFE